MVGRASPTETTRMVTEKIAASLDSATALAEASLKLYGRGGSLMGGPIALTNTMVEMVMAAAHPYHTRLNANAKRLSRRKS